MFQKYEYLKYFGYDDKTQKYKYEYKIVDSEGWEEVAVAVAVRVGLAVEVEVGVGVAVGVANVYKKRGYSPKQIAKQLFLCFRYSAEKYHYSLDQIISWSKQYHPELWQEYGEDLKMWLLFT